MYICPRSYVWHTKWRPCICMHIPHEESFFCFKMKRQSSVDSHFKRSIKLKNGELVECVPTQICKDSPLLFPCQHPGCAKTCTNKGALANHMNFAQTNYVSKYVVSRPKNISQGVSYFLFFMHGILKNIVQRVSYFSWRRGRPVILNAWDS